jgi:hypothetical protein
MTLPCAALSLAGLGHRRRQDHSWSSAETGRSIFKAISIVHNRRGCQNEKAYEPVELLLASALFTHSSTRGPRPAWLGTCRSRRHETLHGFPAADVIQEFGEDFVVAAIDCCAYIAKETFAWPDLDSRHSPPNERLSHPCMSTSLQGLDVAFDNWRYLARYAVVIGQFLACSDHTPALCVTSESA